MRDSAKSFYEKQELQNREEKIVRAHLCWQEKSDFLWNLETLCRLGVHLLTLVFTTGCVS